MTSLACGRWAPVPGSPAASKAAGTALRARVAVLELAFGHLGAEEACTEYLDGNHASEKVSRKLGYTGNGRHFVYWDDGTGRTTEYRLRLDRRTWQDTHDGTACVISGLTPCFEMFGLDGERDQEH